MSEIRKFKKYIAKCGQQEPKSSRSFLKWNMRLGESIEHGVENQKITC